MPNELLTEEQQLAERIKELEKQLAESKNLLEKRRIEEEQKRKEEELEKKIEAGLKHAKSEQKLPINKSDSEKTKQTLSLPDLTKVKVSEFKPFTSNSLGAEPSKENLTQSTSWETYSSSEQVSGEELSEFDFPLKKSERKKLENLLKTIEGIKPEDIENYLIRAEDQNELRKSSEREEEATTSEVVLAPDEDINSMKQPPQLEVAGTSKQSEQVTIAKTTPINYSKMLLEEFRKKTKFFLEKLFSASEHPFLEEDEARTTKNLERWFKKTPYYKLLDNFFPKIFDVKGIDKLSLEKQQYVYKCAENRINQRFNDFLKADTTEDDFYKIMEHIFLRSESEKDDIFSYKNYRNNFVGKELWEELQKIREELRSMESTNSVDAFRELGETFQMAPEFLENLFINSFLEQDNTAEFFKAKDYDNFVKHLIATKAITNEVPISKSTQNTTQNELLGYISSCIEIIQGTEELTEPNKEYLKNMQEKIARFNQGAIISARQLLELKPLVDNYDSLLNGLDESFNDVLNQLTYIKGCYDLLKETILHPEKLVLSLGQYNSIVSQFKELHNANTAYNWKKMLDFYEMQLLCKLEVLNETHVSYEEKEQQAANFINEAEAQLAITLGMTNFVPVKLVDELKIKHSRIKENWNDSNFISQLLAKFPFNRKVLLTLFKEHTTTSTDNLAAVIFNRINDTDDETQIKPGAFSTTNPIEQKVYWNYFDPSERKDREDFYRNYETNHKSKKEAEYNRFNRDLPNPDLINNRKFLKASAEWLLSITSNLYQTNRLGRAMIHLMKIQEVNDWRELSENNEGINQILIGSGTNLRELLIHQLREIFAPVNPNLRVTDSENSETETIPRSEAFKKRAKEIHDELLSETGSDQEKQKFLGLVRQFVQLPNKLKKINFPAFYAGLEQLKENHPSMETVIDTIRTNVELFARTGIRSKPICLVGPPGTGKSRFLADYGKVLGLHFEAIAIPDGSVPRGIDFHYQASHAGRLADIFRKSGILNPVINIDEIGRIKPEDLDAWLETLELGTYEVTNKFFFVPVVIGYANIFATSNTPLQEAMGDRFDPHDVSAPTMQQKFSRFKKQFALSLKAIKGVADLSTRINISDEVMKQMFNSVSRLNPRDRGIRTIIDTTPKIVNEIYNIVLTLPANEIFEITKDNFAQLLPKKANRTVVPITNSLPSIKVNTLTLEIPSQEGFKYGEGIRNSDAKQKKLEKDYEVLNFNKILQKIKREVYSLSSNSWKVKLPFRGVSTWEGWLANVEREVYKIRFPKMPEKAAEYRKKLREYLNPNCIKFSLSNGQEIALPIESNGKMLVPGENILRTSIPNPSFNLEEHNKRYILEETNPNAYLIELILSKIHAANQGINSTPSVNQPNQSDQQRINEEIAIAKLADHIITLSPEIRESIKITKSISDSKSITNSKGSSQNNSSQTTSSSSNGTGSSHTVTKTPFSTSSNNSESESITKTFSSSRVEPLDDKALTKLVVDFLEKMKKETPQIQMVFNDALNLYTAYDDPDKQPEPEKLIIEESRDISREEYLELINLSWTSIKEVMQEHNIPSILLLNELKSVLKKIDNFVASKEITMTEIVKIQLLAAEINSTLEKEEKKYPILYRAMETNLNSEYVKHKKNKENNPLRCIERPEAQAGLNYNSIKLVCQSLMDITPLENLTWEQYERRKYYQYRVIGMPPIEKEKLEKYNLKMQILRIKIQELASLNDVYTCSTYEEGNILTKKAVIMQNLDARREQIKIQFGVRISLPLFASEKETFINIITDKQRIKVPNCITFSNKDKTVCQYEDERPLIIGDIKTNQKTFPHITNLVNDQMLKMKKSTDTEVALKATLEKNLFPNISVISNGVRQVLSLYPNKAISYSVSQTSLFQQPSLSVRTISHGGSQTSLFQQPSPSVLQESAKELSVVGTDTAYENDDTITTTVLDNDKPQKKLNLQNVYPDLTNEFSEVSASTSAPIF